MSGREFSKKTGSCLGGGGGEGGDGGDEEGVGGWGGRAGGRRYRNRRKRNLEEGEGHLAPTWQDVRRQRGLMAGIERSWRRKRRRASYGPGRGGEDTNRDGEGVAMKEPLLRSEREGGGIRRWNDGSEDS
jgi:hypothetical protein